MRYIGLDIATVTGWSFFEDDNLLERGSIQLISSMDLPQKLHYFHLELKHLIERLKPEFCFIEDVFLGISGAKTLAYLARLNGVAINTCFEILQERVRLYEPAYWKANSFNGLNGQSKKWEIQLAVIKHYNIPITGNFDLVTDKIQEFELLIESKKDYIKEKQKEISKYNSSLNRKRNPLSDIEKLDVNKNIIDNKKSISHEKSELKKLQQTFDKHMEKVKNDIAAQTGLTDNIADSCGIAYCGYKEVR